MNFTELNFFTFFSSELLTRAVYCGIIRARYGSLLYGAKRMLCAVFCFLGLTEPQRRVARGRRSLARAALPLRLARAHTLPHTY